MDTIKELYYGNIHPYEREVKKDSEIDRLAKLVLRHDAELRKTLNESETELFGKLKDAWAELSGLNECECFCQRLSPGNAAHGRVSGKGRLTLHGSPVKSRAAVFFLLKSKFELHETKKTPAEISQALCQEYA